MHKIITIREAVQHKRHGRGVVVRQWGSWKACKICLAPEGECNHKRLLFDVSGQDIYDVRFDGIIQIYSINKQWLMPSSTTR